QELAVGREGSEPQARRFFQARPELARGGVPEFEDAVFTAGDERLAAGGKREGVDPALVAGEGGSDFPCGWVTEPGGPVLASPEGQGLAVGAKGNEADIGKAGQFLARGRVPQDGGTVLTPGGHRLAVRGKNYGVNGSLLAGEGGPLVAEFVRIRV